MIIYPYKAGSRSVSALKNALGIKAINVKGKSKFKGNPKKVVLNWGSSSMSEEANKCQVINNPDAVAIAANKKDFFEAIHDSVQVPEFTTDEAAALEWINQGAKVVVREKLTGNSGDGIVLINSVEEWEAYAHKKSKLYVKYVPKKDEYRIHVMNGEVIDMQRKARNRDVYDEDVNWQIRNHNNGFIFAREGVEPPQDVLDQSLAAVANVGLDFGAVDVVWNVKRKKAYVLEVNTAPGLEGTTLDNYSKGLSEMVDPLQGDPQPVRLEGRPNAWNEGVEAARERMIQQMRNEPRRGVRFFDNIAPIEEF